MIRLYCEQVWNNKLDNVDEMEKFLERHYLPTMIQEEIENLNFREI